MTSPPPEGGHVGVNRPIKGTQWEPQQMDLVETPRYPELNHESWARGVLLKTPSGNPSHWVLFQPLTGALGWTRPDAADWWDPDVRAMEAELVRLLALRALSGDDAEGTFNILTGGQEWTPVRLVDIWAPVTQPDM